jgi:hypothetical protein
MALRENINPKLVQELLGYSSVQMTLDTDPHPLKGMHQEAMLHLEKTLT